MDLVSGGRVLQGRGFPPLITSFDLLTPSIRPLYAFPFLKCLSSSPYSANISLTTRAKKRDTYAQPVPTQTTVRDDEQEEKRVEEELFEDFGDEIMMDDSEDFKDDFELENANLNVGDGTGGGGISLAGTWWDKEALLIAEEVSMFFDGDLKIYAFKASANSTIRLRIEKLSSKKISSDNGNFARCHGDHLSYSHQIYLLSNMRNHLLLQRKIGAESTTNHSSTSSGGDSVPSMEDPSVFVSTTKNDCLHAGGFLN